MKEIDYTSYEHTICSFDFDSPEEMDDYISEWLKNSTKNLGLEIDYYRIGPYGYHKTYKLVNPNLSPYALAEKEKYIASGYNIDVLIPKQKYKTVTVEYSLKDRILNAIDVFKIKRTFKEVFDDEN